VAATVVVVMDDAAVNVFRGWAGPIGRSVERLAKETVYRQKLLANKRTGAMMVGIHYDKKTFARGIGFDAGSNAPYALFVEEGTNPHKIVPKTPGGMLVFYWAKVGTIVHLRSVKHPGNRPYKFLARGLERALGVWNRGG
jgi:hypothetical protein